jgi:hypothetical protein
MTEMQLSESSSRLIKELHEWYKNTWTNTKKNQDNAAEKCDEPLVHSKKIRLS